jgi:branched-chain amino acid transport system substrate-binding protein
MKMKKLIVGSLIAPMLLLTACAGGPSGKSTEGIKIGTLNPLTGPAAAYGEDAKRGTELAAKEINARDGKCYNGAGIELIHEDDKASADGAVTATKKLLTRDRVNAIVGGASSTASLAAATVTKDQVLHINTLSQSDQITAEGGSLLFQINNTVTQNGDAFNSYITKDMGIHSMVYIGEDSVFNQGTFALLEKDLTAGGIHLVDKAVYQTDTTDYTPILNRLHQAKADAIYIASGDPSRTANILQQLRQIGDFGQVLIAPGNISEAPIKAAGANIEGVVSGDIYTATLDTPENQAFIKAFQTEYPDRIPGRPELTNYEGIYLVCEAMRAAGTSTDQAAIGDAIKGLTLKTPRGNLSWNEKHWPVTEAFFIVRVKNGKAVVIDKVN